MRLLLTYSGVVNLGQDDIIVIDARQSIKGIYKELTLTLLDRGIPSNKIPGIMKQVDIANLLNTGVHDVNLSIE